MLNTPLAVKSKEVDGEEHIQFWQNGKQYTVPAPIRPYVVSSKPLAWQGDVDEGTVLVRPLDTLKEETYHKYSVPAVQQIRDMNKVLDKEFGQAQRNYVRENHCPFIERVAVDAPQFYEQYPEKLEKWLTLDIETLFYGNMDKSYIIAIGFNTGGETQCLANYSQDYHENEREILLRFVRAFSEYDPDCIITFNGKNFDLPRILDRCRVHGIHDNWLGRDGQSTWMDQESGRMHRIEGRLNYDVWEVVDADQSLFGIKNRRLKTVAAYRGLPVIVEDLKDTRILFNDPEKLIKYCSSDVNITLALAQGYLHKDIAISNLLSFPIDEIVNPRGAKYGKKGDPMGRARSGMATLIGRLITQRGMVDGGFIEAGQNRDRYPAIKRIQGAVVDIFQKGRFEDILHVDFTGMYPSIQMAMNISPETVSLIGMEDYDTDANFFRGEGVFCIPDANVKRNLIIHVTQDSDGCVPIFLKKAKSQREEYKRLKFQASLGTDASSRADYLKFDALQLGVKILMNSVGFGVNAPLMIRYGSIPTAALITGVARHLIKFAMNWLKAHNLNPIEVDTDGVYVDSNEDIIAELNDAIMKEVRRWAPHPMIKVEGKWEQTIQMEATPYAVGFWHKAKNYVLRDMDGHLKITGGGFKSSKMPPFIDVIRDELTNARLDGMSDAEITPIIKRMMRIKLYTLEELTMTLRNSKAMEDYNTETLGKKLAKMAWDQFKTPARAHTRYNYVYGKRGKKGEYLLAASAVHEDLDYYRYRTLITKMCDNLGWYEIAKKYEKNPGFVGIRGRR